MNQSLTHTKIEAKGKRATTFAIAKLEEYLPHKRVQHNLDDYML